MSTTTDILIIGGGVIGLSIARELHRAGIRDITIVDKGTCGREASWAAAGMLSPQAETDGPGPFLDLCLRSRDLYPELAADLLNETGVDIELDQTGTIGLAFNDLEGQRLLHLVAWQRAAGLTVEYLLDEEIPKAEPLLPATVQMAARFPNDWQVDNRKLVEALRRYAELNGIRVVENTSIDSVIDDGGHVRGAKIDTGEIHADATVIATGAWTPLIKLPAGVPPLDVKPVRGQIVCVEARPGTLVHVISTSRGYLVPRRDGRILVGSTSEDAGFDKSTTDEATAMLTRLADYLLPSTPLRVTDVWAGLRPSTPDGMPVIGAMPDVEGLIVATGHFRNGILLAPVTAEVVAKTIVDNVADEACASFSPKRFSLAARN
ncbi:MAG TPA: glycine oxidase ThiO [Pyrinomonadaceae bacterium]|nr:glycine oxidase ThiO [Pyrinomonadaceae bacterium]